MIKVTFTDDTLVRFINPETNRLEWYSCHYWKRDTIFLTALLFGDVKNIYMLCTDGEIAVFDWTKIRVENV